MLPAATNIFSDLDRRQQLAFICCALIIAGLFTTQFFRILSSIGMIGLVLTALVQPQIGQKLKQFPKQYSFLALSLIFVLHLLTFIYTDPANYQNFSRDLQLKLMFLLLPLAFAILPPLSAGHIRKLYLWFILLVVLAALFSTIYYLLHFAETNESYSRSKVMLTAGNHVRFSLITCFALVCCAVFYEQQKVNLTATGRRMMLAAGIFLFVFLHVLAVRSGLLAFYLVAGLYAAYLFVFRRAFKKALIIGLIILASPVVSYFALPTFHNKFYNTIEDVEQVQTKTGANTYSLTGRVYSYKTALMVFQENPVIGSGLADLKSELADKYAASFPDIKPEAYLMPHNQFLLYLAAFGVLGLAVFLILFYYPLVAGLRRFDPLLVFHYLIISLSFLSESTLETQLGLTFTLIFILLPLYSYRFNAPAVPADNPKPLFDARVK